MIIMLREQGTIVTPVDQEFIKIGFSILTSNDGVTLL